jgi:malonate transporter
MSSLATIFPLALIVGFGFTSATRHWISPTQIDGVRHFIFNLIMPVFLFSHMVKADLSTQFNLGTMLSFYLPVGVGFVVLFLLAKYVFRQRQEHAAVFALGCTYSNTALVALPVILLHFGSEAGAMVFVIITFHSALLFSLTFSLASDRASGKRQIVSTLIKNPIVSSITLGSVVNLLLPPLPTPLIDALLLAGQPALVGALFVLGANLNAYKIGEMWRPAILISAVKLVILPSVVFWLASSVFALNSLHTAVVTLMSAAPLGVNAYLVAKQIGVMQAELAGGVVLSTVLSAFTLSIWLTVLG